MNIVFTDWLTSMDSGSAASPFCPFALHIMPGFITHTLKFIRTFIINVKDDGARCLPKHRRNFPNPSDNQCCVEAASNKPLSDLHLVNDMCRVQLIFSVQAGRFIPVPAAFSRGFRYAQN